MIIHADNSLVNRLLKAKYFSNMGFIKLNVEATVTKNGFRDYAADVIGMARLFVDAAWNVETMETGAVRLHVSEFNCLGVASSLTKKLAGCTQAGRIIQDCLLLASQFDYVGFDYVRHNCNKVAHELSQLVLESRRKLFWSSGFPDRVMSITVSEKQLLQE